MLSSHSSLLLHSRGWLETFTREIMFMLQCSEQKASHFPALPFRLNPALPDTGPFGIHPLNLFWISTAASGSRAWNPFDLFIKASVGLGFVPAGGAFLPVVHAGLMPIQGDREVTGLSHPVALPSSCGTAIPPWHCQLPEPFPGSFLPLTLALLRGEGDTEDENSSAFISSAPSSAAISTPLSGEQEPNLCSEQLFYLLAAETSSASNNRGQDSQQRHCLAPGDAPKFFPSTTTQCCWLSLKVSLDSSEIKEANPIFLPQLFWGKDQHTQGCIQKTVSASEFLSSSFSFFFGASGSLSFLLPSLRKRAINGPSYLAKVASLNAIFSAFVQAGIFVRLAHQVFPHKPM